MKTILLLEDDFGLQQDMVMILEMHDYHVLAASSCQEALALLEKHDVHLIISDGHLEDGYGTTVLQHIRQHFQGSPLPFILYSGCEMEQLLSDSSSAISPDLFLLKPANLSEVLSGIAKMLNEQDKVA